MSRHGHKGSQSKKRGRGGSKEAPRSAPPGNHPILQHGAVDPGEARRQGGETGGAPSRPEHSAPAEDGSVDAGSRAPLSPRAAHGEERPPETPATFTRPYLFRAALNPHDALEFATWIRTQSERRLGLALHDNILGLADENEGWHTPLALGDLTSQVVRSNLTEVLRSNEAPDLIVQNSSTILRLSVILDEIPLGELLRLVVGDVALLKGSIGRSSSVLPSWPSPADEAYDAIVSEQHWSREAPAFYRQVAIPRMRQKLLAQEDTVSPGTPWHIIYEDLFLRVVAHYTREPTLVSAFADGRDPAIAVAGLLGLEDTEQAYSAVIWAATNFDSVLLKGHPEIAQILTREPLSSLETLCRENLAVFVLHADYAEADYKRERGAKTLYGQHIPWNLSLAEMLMRRYTMTVQEILDVASVAFGYEDEPFTVGPFEGSPFNRMLRIRGWADGSREGCQETIELRAPLGQPLSVPLAPKTIWDP